MNLQTLLMYVARIIALLVAIPVHESAHAWVSYKLGDPTAKDLGRISLNPARHFDPFGALCMILVGFGWAKPVPIDARYYENRKVGMALSSLAGPVSNLLLALLSLIFYKIFFYAHVASNAMVWNVLGEIFRYMTIINVTLGVFNMIPIPPFDGSRILLLFLPERIYFGIMKYERYLMIVVFFLLFSGIMDKPLLAVQNGVFNFFDTITGFVDKIAVSLLYKNTGVSI